MINLGDKPVNEMSNDELLEALSNVQVRRKSAFTRKSKKGLPKMEDLPPELQNRLMELLEEG